MTLPGVYYMKPRVSKVESNPPPGTYQGPINVFLSSTTKDVSIIFTRNGNIPYVNSDRETTFRCEHYNPSIGIQLTGKGTHIITVVAMKAHHIETPPKQLRFVLRTGTERQKTLTERKRDESLEIAFAISNAYEPSASLSLVKQKGTNTIIALAETANLRELAAQQRHGTPVALFSLAPANRPVYRTQSPYRRVVSPSMSLTVPPPPYAVRTSDYYRPESLRSDGILDAQLMYRPPSAFSVATSPGPVTLSPIGSRPPTRETMSRSVTPGFGAKRPPAASRPTSSAVASAKTRPSSPPGLGASHIQLSWFEGRSNLGKEEPGDDEKDVKESHDYYAACSAVIDNEVIRVGPFSEKFEKSYPAPLTVSADVASESKKLLQIIVIAKTVKSSGLAWVLRLLPYEKIAAALSQRSAVTGPELAAMTDNQLSDEKSNDIIRNLNQAAGAEAKPTIPVKVFLLFCRFLIWISQSIPEAYLGLALQFMKEDTRVAQGPSTRFVSKLEYLATLEAYRRTRGAHPVAVAHLTEAFYHGIRWNTDEEAEFETVEKAFRKCALIDEALGRMNDLEQIMYNMPVRPSTAATPADASSASPTPMLQLRPPKVPRTAGMAIVK